MVHAQLDTPLGCTDCHVGNTKEIANAKCLDCHDHQPLTARIAVGRGFHASNLVRGKWCTTCHVDHRGRAFDPTGWNLLGGEARFDHDNTDWPLRGVHGTTACDRCHTKVDHQGIRVYAGTDRACGGCHAASSPHGSTRGAPLACERCHTEAVWRPAKVMMLFNHDDRKDAAMPLLGAHRDLACTKCHPNNQFSSGRPNPAACDNCHRSSHTAPIFVRPCEWCHSPTFSSMKTTNFDHTERTKLELGRHRKLPCMNCHTNSGGVATCESCHAMKTPTATKVKQSHHGTRFAGFACTTCHGTNTWSPSQFNHGKHTTLSLTGKHAQISCRACHRGARPDVFEDFHHVTACKSCHAHTTVHADAVHPTGKYTTDQCVNCHNSRAVPRPRPPIEQIHGSGGTWPLVKGHKSVPCADCHLSPRIGTGGQTTFTRVSPECAASCHEDSAHQGSLGASCSSCHVPGSWSADRFDHSLPFPADATHKVPVFPLRGGHEKLPCTNCHTSRDFAATPATCVGCHARDDAHQGRLGRNCGHCHIDNGNNRFAHGMTGFPLDGGHRTVPCADCHPSGRFDARPRECAGCHPVPAIHRGELATTDCAGCHTTKGW
jgi:hypothetical protein